MGDARLRPARNLAQRMLAGHFMHETDWLQAQQLFRDRGAHDTADSVHAASTFSEEAITSLDYEVSELDTTDDLAAAEDLLGHDQVEWSVLRTTG